MTNALALGFSCKKIVWRFCVGFCKMSVDSFCAGWNLCPLHSGHESFGTPFCRQDYHCNLVKVIQEVKRTLCIMSMLLKRIRCKSLFVRLVPMCTTMPYFGQYLTMFQFLIGLIYYGQIWSCNNLRPYNSSVESLSGPYCHAIISSI